MRYFVLFTLLLKLTTQTKRSNEDPKDSTRASKLFSASAGRAHPEYLPEMHNVNPSLGMLDIDEESKTPTANVGIPTDPTCSLQADSLRKTSHEECSDFLMEGVKNYESTGFVYPLDAIGKSTPDIIIDCSSATKKIHVPSLGASLEVYLTKQSSHSIYPEVHGCEDRQSTKWSSAISI